MSADLRAPSCAETYILPDLAWACLLAPIVRDARPGAVLLTCTAAMRDLCEQKLQEIGREDVTVELRPEGRF